VLLNYKRCIKTRKRCFFLLKSCLKIGEESEKPRRNTKFVLPRRTQRTQRNTKFVLPRRTQRTQRNTKFVLPRRTQRTQRNTKSYCIPSALSASSAVLFISCVPGCSNLFPQPRSYCSGCPARRFPFPQHHRLEAIVRNSWGRSVCRCR
jgi:hypothetical protein